MPMVKYGSANVANPSVSQDHWLGNKCVCGNMCFKSSKTACATKGCSVKVARTVLAKYDPKKYLLSHATIIAAVDVDQADPKNPKSDYLIKPAYSKYVNNNGDAWTKKMIEASYRSFIGANNYCFPAGTRVLMSDGVYRSIDQVKEGDKVINRNGDIGMVTKTMEREATGLVEIDSQGILSRKLFVTSEHPFWAFHARETCPKTGRPNTFNPDKDFYHLNDWVGFSTGVHKASGESYPSGLTPDWRKASDLNSKRDFLTHPVSSVVRDNEEINENKAELIGWFLAEGSYTSQNIHHEGESGIQFALGNDELDVAERLSGLLIKEFGHLLRVDCSPRVYESESGSYNLSLCNIEVGKFFKKWCGKYAWAKKLHEDALWLPKHLQAIILKHCLNGDGCGALVSRGYSLELKSQALIQQFLFISWRLGLQPTYKETGVIPRYTELNIVDGYEVYTEPSTGKKSRPGYMLRISTRDSKRLNNLVRAEDVKISCRESRRSTVIMDNKWILSKIRSVTPSNTTCQVYNIEVEGDNSYIAEGVVVHNCEHVQIPELSKGKVIDAVLREIPVGVDKDGKDLTTYYVDILIATDRKHEDLIRKIEAGETNKMSMGCQINYSICSKCGNKAIDETQACEHVKYQKNNSFFDEQGVQRKIAELCGHADEPDSVKFVDASWVATPAFTGAEVRNIIDLPTDIEAKMEDAHTKEGYVVKDGDYLKAATIKKAAPKDAPEEEAPADAPAEEAPAEEPAEEAPAGAPEEEAPAEEAPMEAPAEEPEDDTQGWKKKLKKKVLDQITNEVMDELSDTNMGPGGLESLNDTLIKPASVNKKPVWGTVELNSHLKKMASSLNKKNFNKLRYGAYIALTSNDLTSLADFGFNKRDFLAVMSFLDDHFKNPLPLKMKKALVEIGGAKDKNPVELLTRVASTMGRKLSMNEAKRAVVWLKLMDYYKN